MDNTIWKLNRRSFFIYMVLATATLASCAERRSEELGSADERVGTEGAIIDLGDITVTFASGTFSEEVEITVTELASLPGSLPPGIQVAGDVVEIVAPEGVDANRPFEIKMSYTGTDTQNLRVVRWTAPADDGGVGGLVEDVTAFFENGSVTFTTMTFGTYVVIRLPPVVDGGHVADAGRPPRDAGSQDARVTSDGAVNTQDSGTDAMLGDGGVP